MHLRVVVYQAKLLVYKAILLVKISSHPDNKSSNQEGVISSLKERISTHVILRLFEIFGGDVFVLIFVFIK